MGPCQTECLLAIGRNRQRFCVVDRDISEQYYRDNPSHDWHSHINWRELNELHVEGSLQPIGEQRPTRAEIEGQELDAVPDYVFEWLIAGRVIRAKRHIATRGMAAKYGEFLAAEYAAKKPWARAMVAQMRGELETSLSKV